MKHTRGHSTPSHAAKIRWTTCNRHDPLQFEMIIAPPSEIGVEEIVVNLVLWLKLVIEAIGALVIGIGMMLAGLRFTRGSFPPMPRDFTDVRLTLARFLAIALEFQLGADILSTAVAPSWEAIGKLAAIAVIRTALNYFLSRDMQEEQSPTLPMLKAQG